MLSNPCGLGIDADRTIYVADCDNGRILLVDASGRVSTFGG
jgi:hypothetical protein